MMLNRSSSKKDKVSSKKQTKGKKDKIQMFKKKRKRFQNKNWMPFLVSFLKKSLNTIIGFLLVF